LIKNKAMNQSMEAFGRLTQIMDELREKCPWDKKQTMESLRHLTIEETFELSDAILEGDLEEVKKELGDLLLHIVFYTKIAHEKQAFDLSDMITSQCEKLIRRHPHVYGEVQADDEETVKRNWETIKQEESGGSKSVLSGVPNSLPALIKAMRIQEKARGAGFDWEEPHQVWEKVQEELNELNHEASLSDNQEKVSNEFGDVLFSLINYARFIGVNPEEALEKTNRKFIRRFQFLELAAKQSGKTLHQMSLSEMDSYWEEAKKSE
jgi:tetrapyrrole methylase family protein / MazG family protein